MNNKKNLAKRSFILFILIGGLMSIISQGCGTNLTKYEIDNKQKTIDSLEKVIHDFHSMWPEQIKTAEINSKIAARCIHHYKLHNDPLMVEDSNTSSDVRLNGFMVVLDTIRPLLYNKDLMYLYLETAINPYDTLLSQDNQHFTFILSGLDKDSTKIKIPGSHEPLMYEYLKPCPYNCPK